MKFDPSLINHQCTILMDDEPEIILDPCHSYHNNHHHDHASKKRRNANGNGNGPMILYASYGVQGIRDSMEDSVIIYHPDHPEHPYHHHQPHNHKNHVEPPLSYFGVFDGHGGASCSQFLSNTQLWNKYLFITDDDDTTTTKSSLSSSHNNNNNNHHHHQLLLSSVFQYNIKIEQMFMDVDREYERYQHENCWVNQKIDYETDSGSTACMLFILNNNNNNNSNNHNTTEISNELHDNDSTTIIEIQKKHTKNNNNKKKKKTKGKNNDKQATTTSTNNNKNNKNNRAELIICNAGDSRCIIYSNDHDDTCVLSTVDHKPRSKNEKKRIESSGSLVIDDRINGDLAVSRGFGDFTFKQFKQQQQQQHQKFVTNNDNNNNNNRRHQPVIPIPDIHRIPFQYKSDSGDDDNDNDDDDDDVINNNKIPPFVVLACDGVWDVMNNRQVIQFIVHRLKQQQQESSCNHDCRRHYDVHSIVKELVEYCVLEQKSNDNVSVMIVLLPHVTLEL